MKELKKRQTNEQKTKNELNKPTKTSKSRK